MRIAISILWRSVLWRAALLATLFVLLLFVDRSYGADPPPPPMQWSEAWTFYGAAANVYKLGWRDANTPPGDFYEVRTTWLERPSYTKTERFSPTEANRKLDDSTTPSQWVMSRELRFVGAGHFHYDIRICFLTSGNEASCSIWTSSLDPQYAQVNGQPRGWWVYGYLTKPTKVVPLPATKTS